MSTLVSIVSLGCSGSYSGWFTPSPLFTLLVVVALVVKLPSVACKSVVPVDDEFRENFDLTNIDSAGFKGLEITLPGVHSDIGGSYRNYTEGIDPEKRTHYTANYRHYIHSHHFFSTHSFWWEHFFF